MVEKNFSGMIKALSYGAPTTWRYGKSGIDRIVMLLAKQKNIREVTLFPLKSECPRSINGSSFRSNRKTIKRIIYKNSIKKINFYFLNLFLHHSNQPAFPHSYF